VPVISIAALHALQARALSDLGEGRVYFGARYARLRPECQFCASLAAQHWRGWDEETARLADLSAVRVNTIQVEGNILEKRAVLSR
jgi:hypothetical protein